MWNLRAASPMASAMSNMSCYMQPHRDRDAGCLVRVEDSVELCAVAAFAGGLLLVLAREHVLVGVSPCNAVRACVGWGICLQPRLD